MSRRKTPVLPRTRSVTVAGSALQLSYNLVFPPHLPSPSNCFWTDGKLAAWLCDCSLAFSHSPQICSGLYKQSLFFSSLPPFQHYKPVYTEVNCFNNWRTAQAGDFFHPCPNIPVGTAGTKHRGTSLWLPLSE